MTPDPGILTEEEIRENLELPIGHPSLASRNRMLATIRALQKDKENLIQLGLKNAVRSDEVIENLRERVEVLEEAIRNSIAKADDYDDMRPRSIR